MKDEAMMANLTADVVAIIASKLRGGSGVLNLTDRLGDLGLKSFDAIELIFDLEEKFDIEITLSPNDVRTKFETVEDVVDAVQGLVGQTSSARA